MTKLGCVLAVSVLVGAVFAFARTSPSQVAGSQPTFEAASLKIDNSNAFILGVSHRIRGGPGTSDPGRFSYTQTTLLELLRRAWGLHASDAYRIAGPAWLGGFEHQYTLNATMAPDTTEEQFRLMLQNLLIERFKIRLHHESKVIPGYELVVAPGGPKLKESANPAAPDPTTGAKGDHDANGFLVLPPGHGSGIVMAGNAFYVKFQNFTMDELVNRSTFSSFIRMSTGDQEFRVVDKTGLTAKYDFTLKFDSRLDASQIVMSPAVAASLATAEASSQGLANDPSGAPKLFKALEQQLGLRLVKVKAVPVDIIVIDHAEMTPVED